ncbi:MAG: glutamine amidotransferase [Candidatus Thioglobus sp.]|nr:glutamine amidotransferase [Thiotrichales bacterium]MCS5588715.1 glutamine amidotransferase [Candidatus Thioglobus sp.]
MCGIAGIIHKKAGKDVKIGEQMTSMLQALKHRGPDSTGYAMYGEDNGNQILRFKVAEAADLEGSYDIHATIKERLEAVNTRLTELGVKVVNKESPTEYAHRYEVKFSGDMKKVADFVEDIEGVEILSIGNSLELIKDLGDASIVSDQYGLNDFNGSHGIGHTRMATESDVDIRSAHPYWAYPFSDVAVVHNGQLTNYWTNRRALERKGHRFSSNCDSELIGVYLADRISQGADLETAMKDSVEYLDGVFTYLVATKDQLGMAKDVMAAKPMVVYEGDDMIALASEEVAIRTLFDHHIETFDPYHGEVKVWQN